MKLILFLVKVVSLNAKYKDKVASLLKTGFLLIDEIAQKEISAFVLHFSS